MLQFDCNHIVQGVMIMDIIGAIAILLFILPGILAEKINNKLNFPEGKKRSEFKEIVNGIALSFPILFLVLLITYFAFGIKTLQSYTTKISEVGFLILFVIITLVITIITGMLIRPITDCMYKCVNKRREKRGLMKISGSSCWRKFTVDRNEKRYLKIIKDGKEYKGFAYSYSLPDEEPEMILENPASIEDYPEALPLLNRVNYIYVNIEKGIIIEDYDTTKFFDKIEKLSKE